MVENITYETYNFSLIFINIVLSNLSTIYNKKMQLNSF